MAPQAFKRLHAGTGKPQTTKEWVAKVIDNHWVETFIMVLVIFDLLFVATEAGIDGKLICIGGQVVARNDVEPERAKAMGGEVSVVPKVSPMHATLIQQHLATDSAPALRAFAGEGRHEPHAQEESHEHGEAEEVLLCETPEGHHAEHLLHFCHVCSILILCVFMVELLLKWWANPSEFLAGWCHKLDLFVVSVSLFIDTVVISYIEAQHESASRQRQEKETIAVVSFLLILSRSWRVVRICHGFFEQYHHFQEEAEKPREENKILRMAMLRAGLDPDAELEKAEAKAGSAETAVY